MQVHSTFRTLKLFMILCGTAALLVSCGDDETTDPTLAGNYFSASQDVGDGAARTYVTLDADGNPTAVGVRFTEEALANLPDTGEGTSYLFALPTEASATVFDNITLDWNPHGHEPTDVFTFPHFDMHFYMIDAAVKAEINPATNQNFNEMARTLPPAEYMPTDYISPDSAAVPFMGVHLIDSKDPVVPFTEVFIYGSWNGKITFMEPMMTLDWLKTKPTLQETLKVPQKFHHSGYHPTTYSVSFDAEAGEYVIELGGMVMRQAS